MNTKEAHQHFSCECFNQTWRLMDQSARSREDVRMMLATSHASLFHWLNRDDCTPTNLSIGLWQLSRVYVIVNSPLEAMRYAKDCLEISKSNHLSPFCIAYAHEAMSRAAMLRGDIQLAKSHLALAGQHSKEVLDAEDKKLVDSDIEELTKQLD